MVTAFTGQLAQAYRAAPSSSSSRPVSEQKVAGLVEPRVGSQYPDIVLLSWNEECSRQKSRALSGLDNDDLKVMAWVHYSRAQESQEDPFARTARLRLEKLADLKLVAISRGVAKITEDTLRCLERVVAIEAKVERYASGLIQCSRNRAFASESYLLIPGLQEKAVTPLREAAKRMGVGLIMFDDGVITRLVKPGRWETPKAYAYWQFVRWTALTVLEVAPASTQYRSSVMLKHPQPSDYSVGRRREIAPCRRDSSAFQLVYMAPSPFYFRY